MSEGKTKTEILVCLVIALIIGILIGVIIGIEGTKNRLERLETFYKSEIESLESDVAYWQNLTDYWSKKCYEWRNKYFNVSENYDVRRLNQTIQMKDREIEFLKRQIEYLRERQPNDLQKLFQRDTGMLVAFSINLSYNQVSRDLYLPPMYGRNETWIGYYYVNVSYGNVEVEIRGFHNIAQSSFPIVSFNAYSGKYLHAIIRFDNSTRTVNAAFHLENVTFSDGSYVSRVEEGDSCPPMDTR